MEDFTPTEANSNASSVEKGGKFKMFCFTEEALSSVLFFSNRKEFLLGEKILSFQKLILIQKEENDIVASPEHMPVHLKVHKHKLPRELPRQYLPHIS